jgi:serine/threonine-protein kinase RsbT
LIRTVSEVRVPIHTLSDIVAARRRGREMASQIGFSNSDLTLIATAISEVTQNIVEFADNGEVIISVVRNGSRHGLKIVASDQGPGIEDVSRVMRDGYSTGKGLGIGLPGTKRLMDEFEITSKIGKGTIVTMQKWGSANAS